MIPTTCILAWRNTGTEEPGGLNSMGSQRVGDDWATNRHTHTQGLFVLILGKISQVFG